MRVPRLATGVPLCLLLGRRTIRNGCSGWLQGVWIQAYPTRDVDYDILYHNEYTIIQSYYTMLYNILTDANRRQRPTGLRRVALRGPLGGRGDVVFACVPGHETSPRTATAAAATTSYYTLHTTCNVLRTTYYVPHTTHHILHAM